MNIRTFLAHHKKKIAFVLIGLIFIGSVLATANYIVIGRYDKYIQNWDTLPGNNPVGVVLGGGVLDGQPRPLLKDRLDAAADLLQHGKVRKLILSGDNRFAEYNEPEVMRNYLLQQKDIPEDKVQLDNAGRSTYETCERASKVFGLNKLVLISESTHLPRAIYLCRSFEIEAYGYKSDGQSSAGLKVGQRFRETMARTKAFMNVYIIGEKTVLGEKISV